MNDRFFISPVYHNPYSSAYRVPCQFSVEQQRLARLTILYPLDTMYPIMKTQSFQHLTSAEKVILALRTAITTGALPAGAQIRQEEIAAQYEVSRMPVREAFRQLEAEGLLVVYPGRGAFVNRLSDSEIAEIYDIRILLEGDALRRAVPRLTPTILTQAEDLLVQLTQAQDGQSFGKLDATFHATLYAPAQRPRLLALINTLRNQVTQFLYAAAPMQSYGASAIREHRQILDACHAGDVALAVRALEEHLHNSVSIVIDSNQNR